MPVAALVTMGIDSMSLNPDSVLRAIRAVHEIEQGRGARARGTKIDPRVGVWYNRASIWGLLSITGVALGKDRDLLQGYK